MILNKRLSKRIERTKLPNRKETLEQCHRARNDACFEGIDGRKFAQRTVKSMKLHEGFQV